MTRTVTRTATPSASRDTRNFDKLFERIVELAPPPIGLGSEAPLR